MEFTVNPKPIIRSGLFHLLSRLLYRLPTQLVDKALLERAQTLRTPLFCPEYPLDIKPRWTETNPHPEVLQLLSAQVSNYEAFLSSIETLIPYLKKIPVLSDDPKSPYWANWWIPALDAAAIYTSIAKRKPKRFFEIGSGNSTKFARRAVTDFALNTEILSIDPHPRAEIDSICDRVIRSPLDAVPVSLFDALCENDVLYVDNSHRALMNSDVTIFFMEILPRLKPGVLVGLHDICWPLDYPSGWANRVYSEQYLLGQLLLWKKDLKIELPAYFASGYPRADLAEKYLGDLWHSLPGDYTLHGTSFWFLWG